MSDEESVSNSDDDMKNAVQYKGVWLMPGSQAYTLFENMKKDPKLQKKLDQHMKELDQKEKDLRDRYSNT